MDGTANLFLLNPNGIVFGENAAPLGYRGGGTLFMPQQQRLFRWAMKFTVGNPTGAEQPAYGKPQRVI